MNSGLGLQKEEAQLQKTISEYEQEYEIIKSEFCRFVDQGQILTVNCTDRLGFYSFRHDENEEIYTQSCDKYGCRERIYHPNVEKLVRINKSPDLRIYLRANFQYFHLCINATTFLGKTLVATNSEYKDLFAPNKKVCEDFYKNSSFLGLACFTCFAQKTKGLAVCNEIRDPDDYRCLGNSPDVDKTVECKLKIINKDYCIMNVAPLLDDVNNCQLIKGRTQRDECTLAYNENHHVTSVDDVLNVELNKCDEHIGAYSFSIPGCYLGNLDRFNISAENARLIISKRCDCDIEELFQESSWKENWDRYY